MVTIKPLRITLMLSTPITFPAKVRPFPFMFDSILIKLMTFRDERFDYDYAEYDPYAPANNDKNVPLAIRGSEKKYYMASSMEVETGQLGGADYAYTSIIRRTDWTEYEEIEKLAKWNRRSIQVGSGIYRNAREMLPGIMAPMVHFYCVGDKEKIEDLLQDLTAIGVKTSVGMGHIEKILVKEIENDYSVIDRKGYPARPIPIDEHPEEKNWLRDYCTYKPPYWLDDNKDMCWIPPLYRWHPL